jgi:hypothetical protein
MNHLWNAIWIAIATLNQQSQWIFYFAPGYWQYAMSTMGG